MGFSSYVDLRIEFAEKKRYYVGGDVVRGTLSIRPSRKLSLKSIVIGLKRVIRHSVTVPSTDGKYSILEEMTDVFDEPLIVFPVHATAATFTLAKSEHTYPFELPLPAESHPTIGQLHSRFDGIFWYVYTVVDRGSRVRDNHELKKEIQVVPRGSPVDGVLGDATRTSRALKVYMPPSGPRGFRSRLKMLGQAVDTTDVVLVVRAPRDGILQMPWPGNVEVSFDCKHPELFVLNEIRVELKRCLHCKRRTYPERADGTWLDNVKTLYTRSTPISLEEFGSVQSEIMRRQVAAEPGSYAYDLIKCFYYIRVKCCIASRERPRHVDKLIVGRHDVVVLNRLCWPIGEAAGNAGPKPVVRADDIGRAEKVDGAKWSAAGLGNSNDKSEKDGARESKGKELPLYSSLDDTRQGSVG